MPAPAVLEAVARLASRDATRTEADLQADVYVLLTSGELALEPGQVARLEVPTQDGTRRRLDVEVGHCVIEVKKDLRTAGIHEEARQQLAGYVATQTRRLGTRYVGVLTDGTDWYLYNLDQEELTEVAQLSLSHTTPDAERLLVWLEAILATQVALRPSPQEIDRRLGASSPAHQLDHATLRALYAQSADSPEVQLKRSLWAKLLRTAFGKEFTDSETLFIDHTLLVLTAEIIAHAVIGFDVSATGSISPSALAQGTEFVSAEIYGVVEADFFDWVLDVPGGSEVITELARRIARFDWNLVEHDVLKVLYESVITRDARRSLGEYYTPDWLADRMVAARVSAPLDQRVLDPACGSGTFLFHAIRAYLRNADDAGVPNGRAVVGVTEHVFGMDVHPVAVTLARVTYLLAIGRERLRASDREAITVPVYLGDSLQWEQRRDLLSGEDTVTVSTAGDDLVEGGGALFGDDLVFPRSVLHDAGHFDRLVTAMADKAIQHSTRSSQSIITPTLRRFGIHADDMARLVETFDTMRRLHESGRNHIWGYYVRNLIRPLWLAEPEHRVDVLVGNPPWLRSSKMTKAMRERYNALCKARGLLTGPSGASGRDLSTLFVVRCVELYLKPSGKFSFVMPHGIITRRPHEGFRSGRWSSDSHGELQVSFDTAWDISGTPTGFPMSACVVHGTQTPSRAKKLAAKVESWKAAFPTSDMTWPMVKGKFVFDSKVLFVLDSTNVPSTSPYKSRFRQGAVLAPRALLFATEVQAGPLGAGAGRIAVQARRTTKEKPPWKTVRTLRGTVERAFYRQVHLGETLLPHRMSEPLRAVLPIASAEILSHDAINEHAGLARWWEDAEEIWNEHKSSADPGSLLDRIDFHHQLSAQLPVPVHRVVYSASGNTLTAARIESRDAIIEHKLYWAAVSSIEEARYLTAMLNSSQIVERVRPLQALGLFGERDIDKTVFEIPIPTYDRSNAVHQELVRLAADAEARAAELNIEEIQDFTKARTRIRNELTASGVAARIDECVADIIPPLVADVAESV